jgi:hypothetical protein
VYQVPVFSSLSIRILEQNAFQAASIEFRSRVGGHSAVAEAPCVNVINFSFVTAAAAK